MTSPPRRPALTRLRGASAPRLLLLCIPHAGAGAAAYRAWRAWLPSDVELGLVHLPGREARIAEAPARRMEELLPPLVEALVRDAESPFALFGHSLGALVAYELARRASSPPRRLFVAGRGAPHLPAPWRDLHSRGDAELARAFQGLGGTPPEVLAHPELLALILPTFRADLEVASTYVHEPRPPLACGVTAFAGRSDPLAPPADVEAWRMQAAHGDFRLRTFEGGHFFLLERQAEFAEAMRDELARLTH